MFRKELPNETVEKPFFALRNILEGTQPASFGGQNATGGGVSIARGLLERPKNADFPDIVHHCEPRTRPLYIPLDFARKVK